MKCAEVMEWMHRYLDHDLSQEEIIEMFRHIDNCPSCADVFDRLSVLSQQLEQLPDVKPPFSLVDSILPQLDELDQGLQERTMKSIDESKVVPFTPKNSRGKFFKGSSMAARTGIGAAAAAVILLIAIFNMPDSMPAADVDMALNQAADTNSGQTMQKTNEAAASEPVAAQDGSADSAAGMTKQNNNNTTFSAPGNNAGGPEKVVTPSAVPTPDSPSVAPDPTREPASFKRQITAEPDQTTATPGVQDMRISSSDPDTGGGNDSQDSLPESKTGVNNSSSDSQQQLPSSQEAGVMGLLPALVAPSPWRSPDGRFDAELAGQQLVLYAIPAGAVRDGWTVLTSLPLEGEWVSGQWSEDSRVFTYVTLQNGSEITKTYTFPDSAVSSAPSGSPLPSSSAPAATPDAATSTK